MQFVALDPERDTPDILQAYVSSFHPSFIGLRADANAPQRQQRISRCISARFRWVAATPWTTVPSPMCLIQPANCGWLPAPGSHQRSWRRMSSSC
ncbi:MAG: SCO family protein [Comamonadaceae bacterium]|nr:SCO family protein [Comamonadaceae bacterium]